LRGEVRRMREDITDEGRDRADGRLPRDAVDGAVHLCEQADGHQRAHRPADRGEHGVLEGERSEEVTARHHQEAGEPGARKLLDRRADEPARPRITERVGDAELEARHGPLLFGVTSTPAETGVQYAVGKGQITPTAYLITSVTPDRREVFTTA